MDKEEWGNGNCECFIGFWKSEQRGHVEEALKELQLYTCLSN